jgi:tetratricopeptide (TPR) repeat protein
MSQFIRRVSCVVRFSLCAVIAGAFAVPGLADTGAPRFASLEAYQGDATVVRLGNPVTLQRGMALEANDLVVTRSGSVVVRFYSDASQLRIGPDSRVQINESAGQRDVEVFAGRLWARVVNWRDRQTRVKTGSTIAAVRGTEFAVDFDGDTTTVQTLEGAVEVANDKGSLTVSGGQAAVVAPGQAPVMRVMVRPQDAVQWALYFQPVMYETASEMGTGEAWMDLTRDSMEAFRNGDVKAALAALEDVDGTEIMDPDFFTYRASLYLAASNLEAADADIARALELKPGNTDALSLQTVIAVAGNSYDDALALGDKAVQSNPDSSTAHLAQSYARQAVFNLEGALESVKQAVALDSDNALAWARLSELHMSYGRLAEALDAARTAQEKDPNLARTDTVLGFAYLTQVRLVEAKEAFGDAIELDQGDPLARLGLGLAKIREGNLADGITEIETAASLDPGNSLIRSYLGKAYYEAKKIKLEGREFELAQQFDPNDPTPWFYQAIAKQTTNRPVEALHDMDRAIELNDNRGVYRSRLLLDSDLAARSSSLGRIYGNLGFQNLALVEGWNSINADPTNYSAHRLLADSYAVLPRHEIARVSELYQSQMLQPINTTAIQPRHAESNLALISSQGPSNLSFNEFNPLFNRDQVQAQITGSYGTDATWLGEAIVSGITGKFSFSAGYSNYQTDGWRDNSDLSDEVANVFMQVELSPKTSVQGEYRYRDGDRGDIRLRFFDDDYFPGERNHEERQSGRLGLKHAFAPNSILLASVRYIDAKSSNTDDQAGEFIDFFGATRDESGYSGEAQYLYRAEKFKLTTGGSYYDVDGSVYTRFELSPIIAPPPYNIFEDTLDTSLKQYTAYAYGYFTPVDQFTAILGVSGDFLNGSTQEIDDETQYNPKFGFTWRPAKGTTIRAAGFKTLRGSLISDQTLEPTNIAGFNQFYDDIIGTSAWRYGGAIDQKFSEMFYGGVEYTQRDLDVPFINFDAGTVEYDNQTENVGRAYVFVTAHKNLALRFEYMREKLETDGSTDLPTSLTTDRFPVGLSYYLANGLGANLTGTYFDQKGDFVRINGMPISASDTFWTLDLAFSYRLPKRYGILTVGATNLLDEEFQFFDLDTRNPSILPTRRIYGRVTLSF